MNRASAYGQSKRGKLLSAGAVLALCIYSGCEVRDHSDSNNRPMDIRFKVVDQFGEPAQDYRVKVVATACVEFMGMVLGGWNDCRVAETDKDGNVRVRSAWKSAANVSLQEIDIDQYIFTYDQIREGIRPISYYTDAPTPAVVHVLKHGKSIEPRQIKPFRRELPWRDNVALGVTFRESSLYQATGTELGDLIFRVRGGKTFYGKESKQKEAQQVGDSEPKWPDIEITGTSRYLLSPAGNDYVVEAPAEGYSHSVEGQIRNDRYQDSCFAFYIYDTNLHRYMWIRAHIGSCSTMNGPALSIALEGYSNSDGSKNLYVERYPSRDELSRRAKSCP